MKNRNQRIVVVGAGGVGGYFAAVLLRSGFAVSVLARGAHLEAIRNLGLKLRTAQETFVVRPEIITDEPRQIGVVDSIILAVKAWQVFDVASTLRPLLGEGTKILPLQNGIEAHTQIACALGSKHALVETCHIVSSLEAPGLIRHHGVHPTIALGELDSAKHSSCAEALAQALTDSGVNVTWPIDIHAALWNKFILLSALSGVGAVTGKDVGTLRANESSRKLLTSLLEELEAIAYASHISLATGTVSRILEFIDKMPEGSTTSMQRDIASAKPSELEAIIEKPIRLAETLAVDTPMLRSVYEFLRQKEERVRRLIAIWWT